MKKPRVLVVDDDASFTRLLKMNLELTGKYRVEVVNQPVNAISAAAEFTPDIILLDVMMPGLDGGDLAAGFQHHPNLKSVPIVFLTAAVEKAEVGAHAGRIGGFPYLAKPADVPEIMACLDKFLERAET